MVYKAYDPTLGRTVAIKIMAPHLVWEQTFLQRFSREARAAAQLQHPNVIPIYDVGQDGNNYYFVMAYLPGDTLKKLIKQKGRFTPNEALPILRQLADALDYAHSKGLVHRDVKPGNVLFSEQRQAVLTDFGIVKAAERTGGTATGVPIGTPQYMAPEQVQCEQVSGRTDEYALGIIAFEMLSGRVPFDGATTAAVLVKQLNTAPPPLTAYCSDLPSAAEAVLNRALAKSPAQRYSSCGEFVQSLASALLAQASERQAAPQTSQQPARHVPTARPHPTPPKSLDAADKVMSGPPPKAQPRPKATSRIPWSNLLIIALVAGVLLIGTLVTIALVLRMAPAASPTPTTFALSPTPAPQATISPAAALLEYYEQNGYEYGWAGGAANAFDSSKVAYFKVSDVTVNGNHIEMKYEWQNGILNGELNGNTYSGAWQQSNSSGNFELVFEANFSKASGWWSWGNTQDKAYIK